MRFANALALLCALSLAACAPATTKPGASDKGRPKTTTAAKAPPATGRDTATARPPVQASLRDRYESALELLKTNRLKDAESLLLEIIKEAPTQSGPHTNLGIVYAKLQRRDAALASFARAVAANPRNATAYNWMGTLHREAKNHTQAEQAYLKALSVDADHAAALMNLGILYSEYLNQPQKALDYYKRYKRRAPAAETLKLNVWIAELEARLQKTATPAPRKI